MAKINAALRERLLGQKKQMAGGGLIIDNKAFEKMRLRLIPMGDAIPGREFMQLYCHTLDVTDDDGNKLPRSCTSPLVFGEPCRISEALDDIYANGDEDDKEFARNYCRRQTEYWLGVFDRADVGTAAKPLIRILRSKQTVYKKIVDWLVDDDMGEDITDPADGCDLLIKKEKTGTKQTDVEWKADKFPPSAIADDEALADAMIAAAERFDVARYFYRVNVAVYCAIYEGLTGESLDDDYIELLESLAKRGGSGSKDEGTTSSTSEDEDGEETQSSTEPEPEESEYPEGVEEGTRVSYKNDDGDDCEGEVVGIDTDAGYEGNLLVKGDDDDPDEDPWSLPVAEVEVLTEPEAEPEPEPEPEPARKPRKKKGAAAKKDAEAEPKAEKKGAKKGAAKKAAAKKGAARKPAGKATGSLRDKLRDKRG